MSGYCIEFNFLFRWGDLVLHNVQYQFVYLNQAQQHKKYGNNLVASLAKLLILSMPTSNVWYTMISISGLMTLFFQSYMPYLCRAFGSNNSNTSLISLHFFGTPMLEQLTLCDPNVCHNISCALRAAVSFQQAHGMKYLQDEVLPTIVQLWPKKWWVAFICPGYCCDKHPNTPDPWPSLP